MSGANAENKTVLKKLIVVTVAMFGFGFALVPLYKKICTVTGLTKVIDGVNTVVMWDRDYSDGELAESELAFFAQSEDGDVWLFGEYPEEFENGEFVGAPSTFISGIAKAQAGIAMQAAPRTGTPAYVQAYAPKVDFLDCGQVFKKHQNVCAPTACFEHLIEFLHHLTHFPNGLWGHPRKRLLHALEHLLRHLLLQRRQ